MESYKLPEERVGQYHVAQVLACRIIKNITVDEE